MMSFTTDIAKETIEAVADVANKNINGNPVVFLATIMIVTFFILLVGVIGVNAYFDVLRMNKNNEYLSKILENEQMSYLTLEKNNELLSKVIEANNEILHELRSLKKR